MSPEHTFPINWYQRIDKQQNVELFKIYGQQKATYILKAMFGKYSYEEWKKNQFVQ